MVEGGRLRGLVEAVGSELQRFERNPLTKLGMAKDMLRLAKMQHEVLCDLAGRVECLELACRGTAKLAVQLESRIDQEARANG